MRIGEGRASPGASGERVPDGDRLCLFQEARCSCRYPGRSSSPSGAVAEPKCKSTPAATAAVVAPAREDARVEPKVQEELDAVLHWAHAMRDGMQREPGRRDEFQMQGHAYVGGVLTTLGHLGLLSDEEYQEWWRRFTEVLGDPPGGWVTLDGSREE